MLSEVPEERPLIIEILNSPWVKKMQALVHIFDKDIRENQVIIQNPQPQNKQIHQFLFGGDVLDNEENIKEEWSLSPERLDMRSNNFESLHTKMLKYKDKDPTSLKPNLKQLPKTKVISVIKFKTKKLSAPFLRRGVEHSTRYRSAASRSLWECWPAKLVETVRFSSRPKTPS